MINIVPANVVVQFVLKINEAIVAIFVELDVAKNSADNEGTNLGGLQ